MRLLAFVGPLKCVCRVVTAFFLLAFLIFPAAAEPALPPISGSNGLMGLWGANNSASQTGSSGKPISGSNDNRAPLLLALRPSRVHRARMQRMQSSSRVTGCRARVESTKRATKCRAFAQCSIRFQWTDRVGRKQLGIADGLKWKADQRFKRPTGHHCSWHSDRVESTERGCTGCRAQVESPDAELESSPPSAPRNVAPSPSAQSGSNGLIEWSANSSESQTGSSGKRISGSNDQQGTTAPGTPTESSPPSADAEDAELKSSPPDAELK